MHGDEALDAFAQRLQTAARSRNGRVASGQCTRRRRAERHGELRLDQVELLVEPPAARFDLVVVRLLVDAALAARLELEVLHGIRDIDARAIDAGFGKRAVEHLPGRTHEWLAGQVLLIARLFADEHERCVRWSFAEDGLRRVAVEGASLALLRLLA